MCRLIIGFALLAWPLIPTVTVQAAPMVFAQQQVQ